MIKQSHNLMALELLLYSLVCPFFEVILVHFNALLFQSDPLKSGLNLPLREK